MSLRCEDSAESGRAADGVVLKYQVQQGLIQDDCRAQDGGVDYESVEAVFFDEIQHEFYGEEAGLVVS